VNIPTGTRVEGLVGRANLMASASIGWLHFQMVTRRKECRYS
jgi:hypothetical protein